MNEEILGGIEREDIKRTKGFQRWLSKEVRKERSIKRKEAKEKIRIWNAMNKNQRYKVVNKYLYKTLMVWGIISLSLFLIFVIGLYLAKPYLSKMIDLYSQNKELINSFLLEKMK